MEVGAGRKFFPSADVQQMVADFLAVSILRNNKIEEKKYHQLMWWPEQPFNMTLMSSRASWDKLASASFPPWRVPRVDAPGGG